MDDGPTPGDPIACAIAFDHTLESAADAPDVPLNEPEKRVFYAVPEDWLRAETVDDPTSPF